jgi:hypothetical protein
MIGNIQSMQFNPLGILSRQFVKRIRFFGMATTSQNMPALCGVLPAELQSNPAVSTRNQSGFHRSPRFLFGVSG